VLVLVSMGPVAGLAGTASVLVWAMSALIGFFMAIAFAGVDKIVAGSDYPHQIGSLELMKSSIASLAISEEDKNKIRAGNATRILKL